MKLIGALLILGCFPLAFAIDDPDKAAALVFLYSLGVYLLYFRKGKGAA